jgi:hypothetical protein
MKITTGAHGDVMHANIFDTHAVYIHVENSKFYALYEIVVTCQLPPYYPNRFFID